MEKKCFFWSPKMSGGWVSRELIRRKKGLYESPFFVDYKSGMGYTLLRRTNL